MTVPNDASGVLLAVGDLHVTHPANRKFVQALRPQSDADWLIVCGDVSDSIADIEWALRLLSQRFKRVIWTPGNHELWTPPDDGVQLRGEGRYHHLVEICRRIGVLTPEDPFAVWEGRGGPLRVIPLFLLYDYSFGRALGSTKARALARADRAGVVCTDEFLLHPDPYVSRAAWCHARVAQTEQSLEACDQDVPSVIVNHFPLTDHPTSALFHPEFALWCGTMLTADWHLRFGAATVVYGHLHIPRTTWHDGVRFEEVSLGFPHEWHRRNSKRAVLRRIAPTLEAT